MSISIIMTYQLQAEIDGEMPEPLWLTELRTALRDPNIDSDSVKVILNGNPVPSELRISVWQILLGVKGRSNNFDEHNCEIKNHIHLERATRKLGSKQHVGQKLIGFYLNSKDEDFDDDTVVDILQALLHYDISQTEVYNLFYSINSKYKPKCRNLVIESVIDLLVQFFDPLLSRFIKCRQRTVPRRAVFWIQSIFRNCLHKDASDPLWDIIFQSGDNLLVIWIRYLF